MADLVQEQMGDILSAYGIPELADHIVPIPLQPPDDEKEGAGNQEQTGDGAQEHTDREPKESEKTEDAEEDGGASTATPAASGGAEGSDRVGKKEQQTTENDDREISKDKNSEVETAMETEDGGSNLEPKAPGTSAAPSSSVDIAAPALPVVPDLGLTQSVASLNGSNPDSSLIRDLLKSTSKPVMTPVPQGTLPHPNAAEAVGHTLSPDTFGNSDQLSIDKSDLLSESLEPPSALTSVDEFNSFFDRCRESQELIQMKKELLGKGKGIPTYQCPSLTDEQAEALNMDKETFKCLGCDDTFLFKASLDAHMERRTVLISFHCRWCKGRQTLVFYNRCNFLAHLDGHKASEKDIDSVKVQAYVAPVNALDSFKIFTRITAPPALNDVGKAMSGKVPLRATRPTPERPMPQMLEKSEISNPFPAAQQRLPAQEEFSSESESEEEIDGKKVVTMYPKKIVPPKKTMPISEAPRMVLPGTEVLPRNPVVNSFVCLGCRAKFDTREAMKSHLQQITSKGLFNQCRICKLILANKCVLSMHTIIHPAGQIKSFPCPECGMIFLSLKALFIHQNNGCLHWMRRPLFKCAFCFKYATSFQGLVRHFESNHVETFMKCPLCQLAFRNNESASEHSLQVHRLKSVSYGLLHKCPLCKSVYSDRKMLENHFEIHFQNGNIKIEKFVLTCYKCYKPFDLSSGLRNHLMTVHSKSQQRLFSCDICLVASPDIEMLMLHRFTCAKKCFGPKAGALTNKQSQKQYMCGECGEKFSSLDMAALRKHMMEKHMAQVPASASNSKGSTGTATTNEKATPNASTSSSTAEAATATEKNVQVVVMKKKVERFTELQCAKCDHKSSDRVLFERHITQHKTDEFLCQCHECGLCFTVGESLKRHLFIKHRIKVMVAFNEQCEEIFKKGEEEMKKKKLEAKEKEKETKTAAIKEQKAEEDSADPNEDEKEEEKLEEEEDEEEEPSCQFKCHVCGAEFENDRALTVHKRSHGLAYLQHQLTRSPDKAARVPGATPTPPKDTARDSPEAEAKPVGSPKPPHVRPIIPSDTESSEASEESMSQ